MFSLANLVLLFFSCLPTAPRACFWQSTLKLWSARRRLQPVLFSPRCPATHPIVADATRAAEAYDLDKRQAQNPARPYMPISKAYKHTAKKKQTNKQKTCIHTHIHFCI